MGMSVVLGLRNFFFEAPEEHRQGVIALVTAGVCPVLREMIPDQEGVFEARRTARGVESGWLDAKSAALILKDWEALKRRGHTSASFSWDTVERLGCETIARLALPMDAQRPQRLSLPGSLLDRSPCTSLRISLGSWLAEDQDPGVGAVRSMHLFAIQHSFAIHSE